MNKKTDFNNEIIDLQTKLSFQDDLLEDLNQVVTEAMQMNRRHIINRVL